MASQKKIWDKTAQDYFTKVVSPFSANVINPIFWYIDHLPHEGKSVIEVGCGIGSLLPILGKSFGRVVGTDISPKMIERARSKVKEFENVHLSVQDTRDLSTFHNQFDFAITVNSILVPQIKVVDDMLREVYLTLKEDGVLLGIFPSLDALHYKTLLIQEKALDEGKSEEEAMQLSKDELKGTPIDFISGIVDYDGEKQKHYYGFELKYRLWKAGFKNIRLRKVYYPWEVYDEEHLLTFKGKPKLWDWFVCCLK